MTIIVALLAVALFGALVYAVFCMAQRRRERAASEHDEHDAEVRATAERMGEAVGKVERAAADIRRETRGVQRELDLMRRGRQ